jgi:hypothetical protein
VLECGYYRCGTRRGRLAGEATAQTAGTGRLAPEGELLLDGRVEAAQFAQVRSCGFLVGGSEMNGGLDSVEARMRKVGANTCQEREEQRTRRMFGVQRRRMEIGSRGG